MCPDTEHEPAVSRRAKRILKVHRRPARGVRYETLARLQELAVSGANPWLAIPLEDYERHMEGVGQLAPLADLFAEALAFCRPPSVAVLGVAGGNGLDRVDGRLTTRVVGIDLNRDYLETARRRFPLLDAHCVDLSLCAPGVPPVALVHAALIFEHTGLGRCLENALSLLAPAGWLSVVLQLPGDAVESAYPSVRRLREHFTFIDPAEFRRVLEPRGFTLVHQTRRSLLGGKAFWMGVFTAPAPCL